MAPRLGRLFGFRPEEAPMGDIGLQGSQQNGWVGRTREGVTDLGVRDVEGGDGLHAQLRGVLGCKILRVIGAIEVVTGDGALAARHVAPYYEVRAACPSATPSLRSHRA